MLRRLAPALLCLSIAAPPALAHDFWVEPNTHRRATPGPVRLSLRVGMAFAGEPIARDDATIERIVPVGPKGEKPVIGRDGEDPAGLVRLDDAGLHVVGYRSRRHALTLPAAKFEAYLADEGLEHVIAARAQAGASTKDGVEVYSRAVKSFVRVGDDTTPATGFDHRFGFEFELVPERDPLALRPDDALGVRALLDGRPAVGVLVGVIRAGDAKETAFARTDVEGRAALPIDRDGRWLVHAVNMRAAPADVKADWESIWASLTFDVVAPAPATAPAPAASSR
jgi:uncharacterized GH25 family protein